MNEIIALTPAAQPVGKIDFSRYLPMLDDDDISEEDKSALLAALWSIALSLAQLGWRAHSVQQAVEARRVREIQCGQSQYHAIDSIVETNGMVECSHQSLIDEFKDKANTAQKESDS